MKYTSEYPQLKWSPNATSEATTAPIEVYPPMTDFAVQCLMSGEGRGEKWEIGTLFFSPGQTYVPVVLMDSIGKYFIRHPNAIQIISCGATAANLAEWAKKNIMWLQGKVPLPVLLIISGGGNDLARRHLKRNMSSLLLADRVINAWADLEEWCSEHRIEISFSHIIPRPLEQDRNRSPNYRKQRILLSGAFCATNDWIEEYNEKRGLPNLLLNKYVEHDDKKKNNQLKPRYYPKTTQRRIKLSMFSSKDNVHLSHKGVETVEAALHRYIKYNI